MLVVAASGAGNLMADFRDQLNAYGAANDPVQARYGNYADLPNPQRAEEIVAEARKRVAAAGGNPKNLPGMIQRVTDEFAQRDRQNPNTDNVRGGYQQPNNMDEYIDRVLQVSGMTDAPATTKGSSNASDSAGRNAPITPVDSAELPPAKPAAPVNAGTDEAGDNDSSFMTELLAVGGAGALAAYLRARRKQDPNSGITDLDIANAEKGTLPGSAVVPADGRNVAPKSNVDQSIDTIDGNIYTDYEVVPDAGVIGKEDMLGLPYEPKLTDQSADVGSGREFTNDEIGNIINDRFRSSDSNPLPDDTRARIVNEALQAANDGNMRRAVDLLRSNNFSDPEEILRYLTQNNSVFRNLPARLGDITGKSVGRVVGGAARRAVR